MKKLAVLLTMIIALLASGCAVNTAAPAKGDGYATYKGEGVSFKYPESWVAPDKSKLPASAKNLVIFGDYTSGASFSNNVNITVTESAALAPSAEVQSNQIAATMKLAGEQWGMSDYTRVKFQEQDYAVGDKHYKAGLMASEATISQTGTKIEQIAYIVPIGTKTYTMTITVDKAGFDAKKYDAFIQKMVDTFTVQ